MGIRPAAYFTLLAYHLAPCHPDLECGLMLGDEPLPVAQDAAFHGAGAAAAATAAVAAAVITFHTHPHQVGYVCCASTASAASTAIALHAHTHQVGCMRRGAAATAAAAVVIAAAASADAQEPARWRGPSKHALRYAQPADQLAVTAVPERASGAAAPLQPCADAAVTCGC